MPRKAAGLVALDVSRKPPGRYGDGNGLYLLVSKARSRFWVFRFTIAGRLRDMGLGRAGSEPGAIPLKEARELAGDLYRLVRAGRDPLAERDAAKAARQGTVDRGVTFRDVAALYVAAHEADWRNAKHRQQWRNTLDTYAMPHLGDLPVGMVATEHVLAVLEPIWREKPETASRLRGRIELVLDHAASRGWRVGENPARWRGHVKHLLPRMKLRAVAHHAALPWQAMGAFMDDLGRQEGLAALALRFTILTASRTGEAIGARWSELDLDAAHWTIPAQRMKAGREHRVPLSAPALALLRALARLRIDLAPDAFVFPGIRPGTSLSGMAMAMVLRRMQRPDLTVHGFRSTFRDWCAEATGYPSEVAEAALAHTLRDKVEAAYRRGDLFEKRRRLMEEWAAFCARPVAETGRVVAPATAVPATPGARR